MRKLLCCVIAVMCFCPSVFGWGQVGHDAVAAIAERNLTPKARKAVGKVLDGHSIVYYSSWMDNTRSVPAYNVTSTWHYANVDSGQSLATMERNPKGDVVSAVKMCVEALKSDNINDSVRRDYTRYLVHLVGDMHSPMHAGHLSDLGGNRLPVKFFGTSTNLHSLWDSRLVESAHKWYYTEWAEQLDRLKPRERRTVASGTPEEWFAETVDAASRVYSMTPEGASLSYDYVAASTPIIDAQIRKAGYRLARLLNEIYG